MKNVFLVLLTLAVTTNAHASSSRAVQADTINATTGTALSVPTTGANLISDTATQTLSNKTVSSPVLSGTVTGTYTLGGTPSIAGSAVTGNITGNAANVTATSNSTLTTLSALSLPGSQVTGNISGNAGGLSATLSPTQGGLGVSNPTANGVLVGQGSSPATSITCSNSGYVLSWNGTVWVCVAQSAGGGSTNVVGSAASPQAVTAVGGITVSSQITNGPNLVFVSGSGSAVTVSATPSITACTAAGEYLTLIGESATNTVTLQDNAGLSGSKLQLNGNITLGLNSSITFTCDAAAGNWVEVARR